MARGSLQVLSGAKTTAATEFCAADAADVCARAGGLDLLYGARPMARLTLEQVRAVAQLAALELDEREAQTLCEDLGAILDHFAALASVDVSDVEPTVHPVLLAAGWRQDRAQPSGLEAALLNAAPETDAGGFAVPKVLDGES